MVEIQCPHCEEDVELEDGASGLFDCPHCDEEFSYGDDEENGKVETVQTPDTTGKSPLKIIVKWGCYITIALFALAIISGIFLDGYEIYFSVAIAMAAGSVLLVTIAIGVIGIIIHGPNFLL
jgi:hypothetical protein